MELITFNDLEKKWYPHNQDCFGLTSRLSNLKLMGFFLSVLTLKHFKAVCSPVDALKLSIVFCVKILLKIVFFSLRWCDGHDHS